MKQKWPGNTSPAATCDKCGASLVPQPTCGKCGKVMTPENSRLHPELFLHDTCLDTNLGPGNVYQTPEEKEIEYLNKQLLETRRARDEALAMIAPPPVSAEALKEHVTDYADIVWLNEKLIEERDGLRAECNALTDSLDLALDELGRIFHLIDNEEIRGICLRGQQVKKQAVPVIVQRDTAIAERDEMRKLVASYDRLDDECGTELEGVDAITDVIRILKAQRETLRGALTVFINHECDYMRANNLGDPDQQQRVIIGRKVIQETQSPITNLTS